MYSEKEKFLSQVRFALIRGKKGHAVLNYLSSPRVSSCRDVNGTICGNSQPDLISYTAMIVAEKKLVGPALTEIPYNGTAADFS